MRYRAISHVAGVSLTTRDDPIWDERQTYILVETKDFHGERVELE